MEAAMGETSMKLCLLRDLAARNGVDAILLQRVSSIAWVTGGAAAYVNIASSKAEYVLLVTAKEQYLISNNIEAPRLEKEEQLQVQGWNFQLSPWFETENAVLYLTRGLKLGMDHYFQGAVDLSGEIARLRANLNLEEGNRFRMLGQLCAQAMDATARSVHPGQTEYEIAGLLAEEAQRRGVQATVNLIATDERIFNFRHPLPTGKKLDHYVMIVLCGRRWGLVCSLTRLVHFGKLPEEIRRKSQAVAKVDATMIAATRPGQTLGQVFTSAQRAYAAVGYADEWKLHHQGGPAGYEPREYLATPGSKEKVLAGQVYAWNPSITGTKSEDSVLINPEGFEVLSSIVGWPTLKIEISDRIIERPDILIVD
jgi:Xaa-Pro aminopeptidase